MLQGRFAKALLKVKEDSDFQSLISYNKFAENETVIQKKQTSGISVSIVFFWACPQVWVIFIEPEFGKQTDEVLRDLLWRYATDLQKLPPKAPWFFLRKHQDR